MTAKHSKDEAGKIRVKDFTYYPLMDSEDCAFRVEGKRGTYHRCGRSGRVGIEGYRFCLRHAEIVRNAVKGQVGPCHR